MPGAADPPLDQPRLDEARRLVQAARALAVEQFPYLDTALYAMVLCARPGLGTVACDARWRFYYDPERTLDLAAKMPVLIADWIHEVGHLLRDHHQRWEDLRQPAGRQPVFNTAGDALINHDLRELRLPIQRTDVTFARLPKAAGAAPNMTTEHIYRLLLDHDPPSNTRDCGSGAGGKRRPWEEPTGDPGDADPDDGSVNEARAGLIQLVTAEQIRKYARTHRGDLPAGLRRWAEEILDPIVDWRRELRAQVTRALGHVAGRTDYTWARPSRRQTPGYLLPGMMGVRPPRVSVVIDTSGSMTDEDLGQCLAEIQGMQRAVSGASSRLRVVPCDAAAHGVQAVRSVANIELLGGGGTDMSAGLERAAGLSPRSDVIVVLTDGETDWPDAPPAQNPRATYIAVILRRSSEAPPTWIRTIHTDR